MINALLAIIVGYLLGSVNASIIFSKLKGDDIRNHGSGNAGATNTLRTYGKGVAAAVTLFDVLKGVVAVLFARYILKDELAVLFAGFGAVLGHNYPVYFDFKGGKGILTSFAVALMVSPLSAVCALVSGVVIIAITRYVSLGSVMGSVVLAIASFFFENGNIEISVLIVVLALLAIFRHKENISRLINGTERKLGEKKEN